MPTLLVVHTTGCLVLIICVPMLAESPRHLRLKRGTELRKFDQEVGRAAVGSYRRGTLDVHWAPCLARGQAMSCRRRLLTKIAEVYGCFRAALDVAPPQRQSGQCGGPSMSELQRATRQGGPLADASLRTQSIESDLGCTKLTVSAEWHLLEFVIPAGVQCASPCVIGRSQWIPAFAGMTAPGGIAVE